jgi:hypothetical protein
LWAVNTDYEYQESGVIIATGLQPCRAGGGQLHLKPAKRGLLSGQFPND